MHYFVYILLCADGTYYTGSTNNLEKRVRDHNFNKNGAKYTHARRPVSLIYSESYQTFHDARVRENEIKKLTRAEKMNLIKIKTNSKLSSPT